VAISVVIPCHNGVDDTLACLRSLEAQEDVELEALVVDNGSTDATGRLAAEMDGVRVLRQPRNLGFAGGVNRGVLAARHPLIVILNNDTVLPPSALRRLVAALSTDARIGLAAPVSDRVKGEARIAVGDLGATEEGRREIELALAEQCGGIVQDVASLSGLCLAARRETLERIGLFDDAFGLGNFEDDDLCRRARLHGYRLVIARDSFVHHRAHRTFSALGIDYAAQLRNNDAVFTAKWRDDAAHAAERAVRAGDLPAAATRAARALEHYPRWPEGHLLLARAAAARGDHAEAAEHARAFVELCKNSTEGRLLLAFELLLAGDERRGLLELRTAFATCFFTPDAAADALGRLARHNLERRQLAAAKDAVESALAERPDDGTLHNLLGAILLEGGALEQARAAFLEGERRGDPHATANLGVCLWRLGEPAAALQTLARAAAAQPASAYARQNLAAAVRAAAAVAGRGAIGAAATAPARMLASGVCGR
jgi:GT2 family glycosyltransferase